MPQTRSQVGSSWRNVLHGFTDPLKLPVMACSSVLSPSHGTQAVCLSDEAISTAIAFAATNQLTLTTLIYGAWAILLSRYSAETDILFGIGRARHQEAGPQGLAVNVTSPPIIPLRVAVHSEATILFWLKELEAQWVALEKYESTTLEQIQAWSDIPQGLPLFETLVIGEADRWESDSQKREENGKKRRFAGLEHDRYPLILSTQVESEGLLELHYERSRFGDGAIARMLGHLETLLTGIMTEPEKCLAHLALLTEKEQHQLLVQWNQTERDYPRDKCIHEIFEEQVEKTPEAVAVVFREESLTYCQLNQKANQLAHYLQKLGVKPETLVGICVERSIEMIVGLLGILKAGGAYVPLEPAYPPERLAFMLEDAQVSVLLTQESLLEQLPAQQAIVVALDRDRETLQQESPANLSSSATADNLAYVIYTSGSTGKPKGVAVPHRAINRLVLNTNYIQLEAKDRVAQVSNTSFDAATFEIWGALLNGAQLVGIAQEILLSPQDLTAQLSDKNISVLFLTTALFNQLARNIPDAFKNLRYLLFGGEAVDPKWVQEILKNGAPGRLLHVYGPTENTTFSSCYWVQDVAEGATTLPIGRPISNTQIYLLDSQLQPVPLGVPGELYLGGEGLARGYLNRPELTGEKFIPNPFNKSKLYRTGDLARYLPDGNIEFLGRIDNQVKIRGFRIELAEIEAVLSQHPAVGEIVVIAREDIPGDKRLVAYVVIQNSIPPNPPLKGGNEGEAKIHSELRSFLKRKLPEYMIPSAFVLLETLPLTPNGKIDRCALPAPDISSLRSESTFAAPSTPTEEILANIWAEVLRVEPISIHDNFFELGGHSLLATQVVSRIRQAFSREIPLRTIFELPTIAELAKSLETVPGSFHLPSILPVSRSQDLPLSFAQQRLWFLDQLTPDNSTYNLCYGFRLQGVLNLGALEQSLGEIVRRHEVLRTTFPSVDGQATQVISSPDPIALPVINLQQLPSPQQEVVAQELFQEEAQQPFDLARGPLLRVQLLRFSEQDHLLLLNIHHIVFDGWSFHVLFEELNLLYEAFSGGKPWPLAEPTIQYADFALWQRQWLTGEVLAAQLDYWKQQLRGSAPLLQIPTDRPRPPIQTYEGASYFLILDQDLTSALKTLAHQEGVTLFMTLLAAFKTLLYRHSGQEDIIVGTPIAGRNRAEIERLMGFFVNSLALRTNLGGNPSFRELLGRLRDVTLGAYAHQDLPFEKLVEELQPIRDLSHTPLFQVWFNMVNFADQSLELTGLTVEPVPILETSSKFDLTIYIREQNQEIHLQLVYNAVLFNAETIQWMGNHFQRLLEGIVTHPECRISAFRLLTETELSRRPNLIRPSNPFTEFLQQEIEQSIPARFAQQVEKYPHNLAIKTKNYQWTYQQLNREVNRIAQTVRENSSENGRISLLFEHDAPMLAAILGVLKSGQTYVPLDPKYPKDRIFYILEDSLSTMVLTNHNNFYQAQELTGGKIPIINVDSINFKDDSEEVDQEISSDTIAYLLYTSGSTGQPKGVMQTHRNVLHFIRNYTNNLHISSEDNLTLLSSYSFDAAVMGIFGALLNGATLCPFDLRNEGLQNLPDWLNQQKITIYHSTPTVFRHLLDSLTQEDNFPDIRLVVLGGEEVVQKDIEIYRQFFSDRCILINGLGPTESTVTLQNFITQKTENSRNTVPVGYPVEETEILLLDEAGNTTDVFGEIAIRSPYIALGYWRKPEITAAAFLPDPAGGDRRIYRTGDWGRLRPDGSLEFLGRKDFQVKIRGFRIELGEIEAVLVQHPAIKENVVIAREDVLGDKYLVAYIVEQRTENDSSSSPSISGQLRHFLKEKLPEYMIPSAFVLLEALPLNPNGKIDRQSLPAPNQTRLEREETFVPPRDELERQLTQIWETVLGIQSIGIHDNFFALGGNSLLVVRLLAKMEKVFGPKIPLKALFQLSTVAQLASALREKETSQLMDIDTEDNSPQLSPNERRWLLASTSTKKRALGPSSLIMLEQAGDVNTYQPLFFVYLRGELGKYFSEAQPVYSLTLWTKVENPNTFIQALATYYIKEIRKIQPSGPYLLGGYCAGGWLAFEIAQQLQAQGQEVNLLVLIETFSLDPIYERCQSLLLRLGYDFFLRFVTSWRDSLRLEPSQRWTFLFEKAQRLLARKFNPIRSNEKPQNQEQSQMRDYSDSEILASQRCARKYYSPKPYSGKVALFFGRESLLRSFLFPKAGLGKLLTGQVSVHLIPGDHCSIVFKSPQVQMLAENLKACLDKALTEISNSKFKFL